MKKKNILVAEHVHVAPLVVELLAEIGKTRSEDFEITVAVSATEARDRIRHADIAIIDMWAEGTDLFSIAVKSGIPTVATSEMFGDDCGLYETDRICYIAKPRFDIKKFCAAICSFLDLIDGKNRQSVIISYAYVKEVSPVDLN